MNGLALDYIREKGLQHRVRGEEIILLECPFCGDFRSHFYIEPHDGQFFCHKCQERGNLITLKKHLGDYQPKPDEKRRENISRNSLGIINQAFPTKAGTKNLDEKMAKEPHAMLLGDAEAMRYLTEERRLTLETINKFNLGLKVEANGSRWLTIPHYQKGKLLNVKSRSLPPLEKEFRRVKDCPSVLFNGDCIEGAEEVYICEGEIDTLTLLQEYTSKGVVGVTAGAGSFDPAWIDHLGKVKRIYLCYDPDEPGQRGAREAARRLG